MQDPFTICSRCRRLKLECKVEQNFKRVGKRSRNAEMEREIVELRKRVAEQTSPTTPTTPLQTSYQPPRRVYSQIQPTPSIQQWGGSQEAAAGLLDLKSGYDGSTSYLRGLAKRIEDVTISQDQVAELFHLYVPAKYRSRLAELPTYN